MWYQVIRELCNGDLTRFDEILELNIYTIFNDLAYHKEKNDLEKYLNNQKGKQY